MSLDRRAPFPADGGAHEVTCRVCYRRVVLDPDRIFHTGDYDGAYWAFRCPECDSSFPVRVSDLPPQCRPGSGDASGV